MRNTRDALLAPKTARLEHKLRRLLPQLDCHAAFAWCGSFGASPTGLPTIGAIPDRPGCFAIMAFGGNGITYSRIAAEVITAQLTGQARCGCRSVCLYVSATTRADGVKARRRAFVQRWNATRVLLFSFGPLSGACCIGHSLNAVCRDSQIMEDQQPG